MQTSDYRDANTNLFWTVLLIALPVMAVRQFIKKDTEKLIQLGSVNDIVFESPFKRYFELEYYYLDKLRVSFVDIQDTRNKGRVRIFRRYYTVPILYSNEDTVRHKCAAWLGMCYEREVNNTKDELALKRYLLDFNRYVERSFSSTSNPKFIYLDKIGNTYDKDHYVEAIDKNGYYKNINQWGYRDESYRVLVPINEPFESRAKMATLYVLGALLLPIIYWLWLQTKKIKEEAIQEWIA
ncbi:hypothetical protein ACFSUS_03820 [Spirosoma soli]|uniref:DUF1523 family protein n=1 Tax=Spirosoma soli TaxID=1770529 RepID=A0ABW5LZN1_9BACT